MNAPETQSVRQATGRELSELTARLGMSVREVAEQISVDRDTVRRFFEGDPSIRERKWAEIESKIRALDEEMGSDREEAAPARRIVISATTASGVSFMGEVSDPADLPALEESIMRLVARAEGLSQD